MVGGGFDSHAAYKGVGRVQRSTKGLRSCPRLAAVGNCCHPRLGRQEEGAVTQTRVTVWSCMELRTLVKGNGMEAPDADSWAGNPKEKAGGWREGLGEHRGDTGNQLYSPVMFP